MRLIPLRALSKGNLKVELQPGSHVQRLEFTLQRAEAKGYQVHSPIMHSQGRKNQRRNSSWPESSGSFAAVCGDGSTVSRAS